MPYESLSGQLTASPAGAERLVDENGRVLGGAQPLSAYSPGGLITLTANLTRPNDATAYASGDLIANSTVAGSVVPLTFADAVRAGGEAVRIERARLRKSGTSLVNASFRVLIMRGLPTLSVGDNGVLDNANVLAISDISDYVGAFDITMDKAAANGARGVGVPTVGAGITVVPAAGGTTLYALIQATAAYTPVSGETFTLTLEGARS